MELIKKETNEETGKDIYTFYRTYDAFDAEGNPIKLKEEMYISTVEEIQKQIDLLQGRLDTITALEGGDTTVAVPENKPKIIA